MQNKKIAISISLLALGSFVIVAVIFLGDKKEGEVSNVSTHPEEYPEDGYSVYANMQNEFFADFACGVTDFESPYVKSVECDPKKAEKGNPVVISMSGSVVDENSGNGISGVKMIVNGGEPFYTDELGFFDAKITIDSNKKIINLVGDKFGFSPIRATYNAQVPIKGGSAYEIPETYTENIIMREIETQYLTMEKGKETNIKSNKYDDVSILIPADGLVNAQGETVVGDIAVEMTYLDPENNPDDVALTPGFNGNVKQMVGINRNGEQVILISGGMLLIHITQGDNSELLQPREGVEATLTAPIVSSYFLSSDEELPEDVVSAEEFFPEASKEEIEEFGNVMTDGSSGLMDGWFYNKQTGLWEEWPGKNSDMIINEEDKTYSINVSRFN